MARIKMRKTQNPSLGIHSSNEASQEIFLLCLHCIFSVSLSRGWGFFSPEMREQLQSGAKKLASIILAPHYEKFAKHFEYKVALHDLDSIVNATAECKGPEQHFELLY